jgi:DNA-3-methyladenine glycosylase
MIRVMEVLPDPWTPLPLSFYRRPADEVAPDLLGRYLVRWVDGRRRVVRLVETEAYLGVGDRASHAWKGQPTPRTRSLYLPGGAAYVYFIYGMHFCLNAVTGQGEEGSAVLLRAGEPLEGEEAMLQDRRLRRLPRPGDLTGGPGKLCQALAVGRDEDGLPLDSEEISITVGEPVDLTEVARGPRVGVAYAGEAALWPLRFAVRGNRHVSRPRL